MNQLDFTKVQYLTITLNDTDQRIDNFILKITKGLPKSRIYNLLRKGEIRVNKKRIKPVYRLQINDIIRIAPIKLLQKEKVTVNNNLKQIIINSIIYEDDDILLLNKPTGIAVHAGSGITHGVIEILRAINEDNDNSNQFIELVHRIDRDTSGCLLLAKKRSSLKFLHAQIRSKSFKKYYKALVYGKIRAKETQVLDKLSIYTTKTGERRVRVDPNGKYANSIFKVIKASNNSTLVDVEILTGRTHQIRVHSQSIAHPIVGDTKYASKVRLDSSSKHNFNRMFLHAYKLRFAHPSKGKIELVAKITDDFEECFKLLKA